MNLRIHKEDSHRIIEFFAAVVHDFPEVANEIVDTVRHAKDGISIEIKPWVADHTDPQRGYYHKWKNEFAAWCGNTPDEMHEYLLRKAYGSEVVDTKLGKQIRPMQRSSKANRTEYSVLIETLIRTAAEMGFDIPPPQRQTTGAYY